MADAESKAPIRPAADKRTPSTSLSVMLDDALRIVTARSSLVLALIYLEDCLLSPMSKWLDIDVAEIGDMHV